MSPGIAAVVAQLRILLVEVCILERRENAETARFLRYFLSAGLFFVNQISLVSHPVLAAQSRPTEDGAGWSFYAIISPRSLPAPRPEPTDHRVVMNLVEATATAIDLQSRLKTPLSLDVERSLRRLFTRIKAKYLAQQETESRPAALVEDRVH